MPLLSICCQVLQTVSYHGLAACIEQYQACMYLPRTGLRLCSMGIMQSLLLCLIISETLTYSSPCHAKNAVKVSIIARLDFAGALTVEPCGPHMVYHTLHGDNQSSSLSSGQPPSVHSLFAYPLESNFSGVKYGLQPIEQLQQHGLEVPGEAQGEPSSSREHWHVFLDAAKACGTRPPDLAQAPADYVVSTAPCILSPAEVSSNGARPCECQMCNPWISLAEILGMQQPL